MRSNPRALRRLRETKGHSTYALSEISGVSQQRISDLEQEPRGIYPRTAKALADALGVSVPDITLQDEDLAEAAS